MLVLWLFPCLSMSSVGGLRSGPPQWAFAVGVGLAVGRHTTARPTADRAVPTRAGRHCRPGPAGFGGLGRGMQQLRPCTGRIARGSHEEMHAAVTRRCTRQSRRDARGPEGACLLQIKCDNGLGQGIRCHWVTGSRNPARACGCLPVRLRLRRNLGEGTGHCQWASLPLDTAR
jgi:hypothetical protein